MKSGEMTNKRREPELNGETVTDEVQWLDRFYRVSRAQIES